jgi:hypothetical protein
MERAYRENPPRFCETFTKTGNKAAAKLAIDALKKQLPGVLWSGQFLHRANEKLISHSGLLCADLDALGERLPESRKKLLTSPYLWALFLSPTADGLKAIFKVRADAAKHLGSFRAIERRVLDLTGKQIDQSRKDLAGLCFVSYDPDLYVTENAVELVGQTEHNKTGAVKKADSESVHEVAIEGSNTEKAFVEPSRDPHEAERKEAKLVADFVLWSGHKGREFKRLKIVPKGEVIPIFSDLYCKDDKQLVEAKGSVSRDAIRMAIGQIYDYRRFTDMGTSLAILLPEIPRPDLIELIRSAGITMIYRSDSGFVTEA